MEYKEYKVIEGGIEYKIVEYPGEIHWCLNNLIHRENGPAIIYENGTCEYWLNCILYLYIESNQHWLEIQKELIIKEIIE